MNNDQIISKDPYISIKTFVFLCWQEDENISPWLPGNISMGFFSYEDFKEENKYLKYSDKF